VRKSLSFAVISRVIANLSSVATAFISIRLYNLYVSKEIYGTILVGLQIIGYLPLMSGGFRMVLNQQMLAQPDAKQTQAIARFGQTLQTYFFVFVVLGGMAVMAIYGELPKLRATDIPIMVFISAGAAAAFTFQAGSQLALLVAFGEQAASALIQGTWGILTMGILWLSFALGSGIWAFPISNGGGALLVIIIARIMLTWTRNDVPLFVWKRQDDFMARFKAVWRAACDCLYTQVGAVLIFTLDLILIGILIGPGPAAVYGVVSRMMAVSRQVLGSLSEAAWPRLTQELDDERKAQIMHKVDRLNAWLVGSWYGAMGATLLPFLGWLVKPDWVATPLLAVLILVRHFVVSLVSPHSYGLLSAGQFGPLARLSWMEVAINSIAGVTLCFTLGVNGVAVAFLLGTCSVSGWQLTRNYFALTKDKHWLSEWVQVVSRGLTAAAISTVIAATLWTTVKAGLGSQGWLAIPAGGIGFIAPVGLVLLYWRRTGKIL
jgi:O-antigen/teichoic acid export membrane protein